MIRAFIKKLVPLPILDILVLNYERLRIHFQNFEDNPPIFLYQMGKVGSKSIKSSLQNAQIPHPIYHIHFLSQEGINRAEEYFLSLQPRIPRFIRFYTTLRKIVEKNKVRVNWKIITGVRERISWEISNFFENVELYWPHLVGENGRVKTDQAIEFLRNTLMNYDESTDYVSQWFDRELKSVFNIDVYAYPFNHNEGFTILSERNVNLLIYRLEDLDRSFNKAITNFLGLDKPLNLLKSNVGEDKKHADEYRYVMENISVPKSVCNRIYHSRYARHFYTQSMRNEFIQKWTSIEN